MLFRNELTLEQVQVPVVGLHDALDGFKIVHLSDIHFLPFTKIGLIEQAVAQTRALQPDLVVLTGDFVTHEADTIFGAVHALSNLNATYGVFAVLGNHDARTGARIVRQGIEEAGISLLHNRGFSFDVGHGQLNLAGVDDCIWGHPDIHAALDGLSPHAPTLLLAHEPDVIDDFSLVGPIALQLSGHTHGGQVRLPILGTPVLPKLGEKYVHGLYRVNESWVYTNRGLGMVSMPIRFNCPPEITEITLCRNGN
ncbi:MAG: metallophosphoesterase [Caldilineaceae bacterium]